MNNLTLYGLTVFIWGSTWIGIKFQLGEIDPMVSVAHRFILSGLLIFVFLLLRRQPLRLPLRQHLFILLQGWSLFCLNYWLIYTAEIELTSGLVAVVFSTMVILNTVNGVLFLGLPARRMVVIGGMVGLVGMAGVFWPELAGLDTSDATFTALLACFGGTCLASWGNMLAVRNLRQKIPVLVVNAYGMTYGALSLYLIASVRGVPIVMDWSLPYVASLLYLVLFGSIIAFWAYITLLGRIGADRASYSSLLFPLVALGISTVVEDYQWTLPALLGIGLVLFGNWLVMRKSGW